MLEIYVLTGGDVVASVINAIAAFFNSSGWGALLRYSLYLSIIVVMFKYIGTRDLVSFFKWVFVYVVVILVLIVPKKSVQVIDLSNHTVINKVDNVPIGLAGGFSLITRIGYGVAEVYDEFFSMPDSLSYSKTGFLFGATLANESLSITASDPTLKANFNVYVSNCVLGDIYLNRKYGIDELMESNNIIELITANPSPVRRMIYQPNRENITCKDAASKLKTDINAQFSGGNVGIWGKLGKATYSGNNADRNNILQSALQDSNQFFYNNSQTATDILKQNIAITAVKSGFSNYAGKEGAVGSLVSITAESSQMKARLNWAVASRIGTTYLPLIHTVMMILLLATFPLVIAVSLTGIMKLAPLKFWGFSLIYFMSWAPLFSILNYVMSYYMKSDIAGNTPVLANSDKLQLQFSDLSMVAGYLTLSIPIIALGIVKGFASVMTHASNFVGSAFTGATTQTASSAADGNWSIGNISTDMVQGNKWNNNYSHESGMQTMQLSTGGTKTVTPDGAVSYSANQTMSVLPTSGNYSSSIQSKYGESIRAVQSDMQDSSNSIQETNRNVVQGLTQLAETSSHTSQQAMGSSINNTSAINKDASQALDAINNISSAMNISQSEAVQYANAVSSSGTVGLSAGIGASGGGGNIGANIGLSKTTGSTDSIIDGYTKTSSGNENDVASNVSRYNEAMSNIQKYSNSESVSKNDAQLIALSKNISSLSDKSFAETKTYMQKEDLARSLTQDADYHLTQGTSLQSNINSEFANWVNQTHPEQANHILTNASDPTVREQREKLYDQYIGEYVDGRVNTLKEDSFNKINNNYNQVAESFDKNNSKGYNDNYDELSNIVVDESKGKLSSQQEIESKDRGVRGVVNLKNEVFEANIDQRKDDLVIEKNVQRENIEQKEKSQQSIATQADNDQWYMSSNPINPNRGDGFVPTETQQKIIDVLKKDDTSNNRGDR